MRTACVALLACLIAAPATAEPCRQALALGLDVSGSVDAREYRLQLDGVATALEDDAVSAALLAVPEAPVRLLIYEWSGPEDQVTLVPWTQITPETLAQVAALLRGTERRQASPGTALGTAMLLGARHLATQTACLRRTLDISGDGKSNLGPRPREVKDGVGAEGITVNGLVIGVDDASIGDIRQAEISELSAYFRAEVIVGPDAFVETALGFEGYADAMVAKLLRELDGMVMGSR